MDSGQQKACHPNESRFKNIDELKDFCWIISMVDIGKLRFVVLARNPLPSRKNNLSRPNIGGIVEFSGNALL